MARLRAALRWLASEDPENGWLVRAIGTIALIAVLVTTRPHSTPTWVWPVYGAAFGCWLTFVVTDPRLPRLSIWALGASSIFPTLAFGAATDCTPSRPALRLDWVSGAEVTRLQVGLASTP